MKKNKRTIVKAVKEICFAAACVLITALFMLICVAFAAGSSGKSSGGLIVFISVCAVLAGLTPFVVRTIKHLSDDEKIEECADEILAGNYSVEMPDVKNEYEPIIRVMKRLSDALAFVEKTQTDFINDFAHELKTPIVSIKGFAKIVAGGEISEEEKKEYLSLIVSESDRLIDLTANTLLLDRLGANSLEVDKKEFSLSETARKEILILQDKWESKNIEVEVELNEVTVNSNPELVGQMILNVIENAVKYTPDNGKITVTDGVTADGVFLTIKDDGIGMDDETGRRMFDRYYRGDKSRQKGGNGLGLATVKKIAEVLGVKISVNTAPDEGTEFTFIF